MQIFSNVLVISLNQPKYIKTLNPHYGLHYDILDERERERERGREVYSDDIVDTKIHSDTQLDINKNSSTLFRLH